MNDNESSPFTDEQAERMSKRIPLKDCEVFPAHFADNEVVVVVPYRVLSRRMSIAEFGRIAASAGVLSEQLRSPNALALRADPRKVVDFFTAL